MSKALTRLYRESKGDVDQRPRGFLAWKVNAAFPSYFEDFCAFAQVLALQIGAMFAERRSDRKREIPSIAAIMAIV